MLRPVLLIDEAQKMLPAVLNELRLLSSTQFDSQSLLTVVLAGDARLTAKLRRDELLPLGSRMRTRLVMEYADRKELLACLKHLLASIAAQLLASAVQQEITRLDEKLYLEVFGTPTSKPRKPA